MTVSVTLRLETISSTPRHIPELPPESLTLSLSQPEMEIGALGLEMHSAVSAFPWVLGILILVLTLTWQGLCPLNYLPIPRLCTSTSRPLCRFSGLCDHGTSHQSLFTLQPGGWTLKISLNSWGYVEAQSWAGKLGSGTTEAPGGPLL